MGREFLVTPESVPQEHNPSGTSTRYLLGKNGEGQWVHLVDCPADLVIGAHYHDVDQFQVVIRGSGTNAGVPMTPGTVHFAEKNTPYGPIVAGPDGLTFMVTRPNTAVRAPTVFTSTKIQQVKDTQEGLAPAQAGPSPR